MKDRLKSTELFGTHGASHIAKILNESIQEFPGPVAIYDENDNLITYNRLYEWVHGQAFETVLAESGDRPICYADLVRESAKDVVSPEMLEEHITDRLRAQKNANGEAIDRFYPNCGWFRIVKVRTPSGAIAGFATDITELKEKTLALERARADAEAANAAKSAFLANMSHELRTPLNAIIGLSDALGTGVLGDCNEKDRQYLTDIRGAGHHLLSLINDLLDISKVEAGAMGLECQTFHLPTLLQECVHMMEPIADKASVTLITELSGASVELYGDPRKIKQVILNILSNAVKFSYECSDVKMRASITQKQIVIEIEDHGIGIEEENIEHAFKPFGRLNHSLSAPAKGAGLGLSIAKSMIALHHGTITLASHIGEGTTVTITLPTTMIV
ncbi:MAG: HAMP domain-containing sensor histidine kinase [Alphaproteobacteria bacterium]|nr:HAMP domain-containing sensor histidine kinase [Alphaproteobacteria bacterium]